MNTVCAPRTLDILAAEIRAEQEQLRVNAASALANAMRIGDLLLEARRLIPPGGWISWLDDCGLSKVAANRYARMAAARTHLEGVTTIREATAMLVGTPGPFAAGSIYAYPPEIRAEASRLANEQGFSHSTVAQRIGVSTQTVKRWLDPDWDDRERERKRLAWIAKTELIEARRAKRIARAVRGAGGAIAELYSAAERMQDVIAQAQRDASSREAREALSRAGEHHRMMRDEIVRALGVS